jgi:N-acetylglucosamine repressor
MKKSITPGQIRAGNRQLIYSYIYSHPAVSQQDLAYQLRLSRPTVSSSLAEMEELGMIEKSGQVSSEFVGRKAAAYSIINTYRIAVGVHIHAHHITLSVVNLYGEIIENDHRDLNFINDEACAERICDCVKDFIASTGYPDERILGVSIVLPGLVSPDGTLVTYGKILDCTGLKIEAFSRHLKWHCRFIHDASSAALSELWNSDRYPDSIYLMLSNHFGAAAIVGGKILYGRHGHAATYEHIRLQKTGGETCYCGRKGCAETLLSVQSLLKGFPEDLDAFFANVRAGKKEEAKRWKKYLEDLAHMIRIIHLSTDTDYFLSGDLAPYITQMDVKLLYKLIEGSIPFPEENDYLHVGSMPVSGISIGGALIMVKNFLSHAM